MPATPITCPSCGVTLKVSAPVPAGKKVKCPKCAAPFVVPGEEGEQEEKPAGPGTQPSRPSVAGKPRQAPARTEREDEEGPAPAEKDEPAPRPRRKKEAPPEEDDYEEERPGKAKKSSKAPLWIALGGAGGLLLVCGVCGVVGVYALGWGRGDRTKDESTKKQQRGGKLGPWQEYRSAKGAFTVEFPGEPYERAEDYGGYSEVKVNLVYPGDKPQATLEVEVTKKKSEVDVSDVAAVQVARRATYAGSEELNDREIKLGKYSGKGWDLKLAGGKGVIKYRMYLVGKQSYLLTAGPTGPVSAADADRFLNSFKLIEN